MSIDYSELIREGHVELPTKFKSFLESEVDSWKASVVSHLWYDHAPLGLHCGSMRCVVCGVGGWVLCVGGGVLRFVCAATSDIPDASVFHCFL